MRIKALVLLVLLCMAAVPGGDVKRQDIRYEMDNYGEMLAIEVVNTMADGRECAEKARFQAMPWDVDISYSLNDQPCEAHSLYACEGRVGIDISVAPNAEMEMGEYLALEARIVPGKDFSGTLSCAGGSFMDGVLKVIIPAGMSTRLEIYAQCDFFSLDRIELYAVCGQWRRTQTQSATDIDMPDARGIASDILSALSSGSFSSLKSNLLMCVKKMSRALLQATAKLTGGTSQLAAGATRLKEASAQYNKAMQKLILGAAEMRTEAKNLKSVLVELNAYAASAGAIDSSLEQIRRELRSIPQSSMVGSMLGIDIAGIREDALQVADSLTGALGSESTRQIEDKIKELTALVDSAIKFSDAVLGAADKYDEINEGVIQLAAGTETLKGAVSGFADKASVAIESFGAGMDTPTQSYEYLQEHNLAYAPISCQDCSAIDCVSFTLCTSGIDAATKVRAGIGRVWSFIERVAGVMHRQDP